MSEPPFDVAKAHRWFAVELNNAGWDLVELPSRSPDETERMIHAAHAACYHWLQVGTPLNHQRAQCLLAKAYVAAGYAESALRHAQRCMELSQRNGSGQTPFDRATANECLARAYALLGDNEQARQFKAHAEDAARDIAEPQEREVFEQLLQASEWGM